MGSVKGSLGGIDNYFLFIFSRLIITADRFEVTMRYNMQALLRLL